MSTSSYYVGFERALKFVIPNPVSEGREVISARVGVRDLALKQNHRCYACARRIVCE
jgi:hypothetical protein